MHATVRMWRQVDNLQQTIISFHHVGPNDQTQFFSSKHGYIRVISLYIFLNLKFLTKQCVVAYAYNPCTCEVEMGESEILGNP